MVSTTISKFQCTQYNPPLNMANLSISADQALTQSAAPENTSKNQWLLNIFYINIRSIVNFKL